MTPKTPPEATGLGKRSRLRGAQPPHITDARWWLVYAAVVAVYPFLPFWPNH